MVSRKDERDALIKRILFHPARLGHKKLCSLDATTIEQRPTGALRRDEAQLNAGTGHVPARVRRRRDLLAAEAMA